MNDDTKTNIIPGYKGIMPLDLTNISPKFYTELIHQHKIDIHDYKIEQSLRPPEQRYENTVMKALRIHNIDAEAYTKYLLNKRR